MTTRRWYVTVERASRRHGFDDITRTPQSVTHAKTTGTTVTLCGMPCTTWPKLWDRDYVPNGDPAGCPTCDSLVEAAQLRPNANDARRRLRRGRTAGSELVRGRSLTSSLLSLNENDHG